MSSSFSPSIGVARGVVGMASLPGGRMQLWFAVYVRVKAARSIRTSRDAQRHRLGDTDAVDPGREDAARIARAFAGRIKPARVEALKVAATGNADRRGGARLDPGHHRVGKCKTLDQPVEAEIGR